MLLDYSVSFYGDMTLSLHFCDLYSLLLVAPLRQVWYLIHFYVLGDTVLGILKINTSSVSEHCLFTHTLCFLANLQRRAFPVSSVLDFLPCTCTNMLPWSSSRCRYETIHSHNKMTGRHPIHPVRNTKPCIHLTKGNKMNSVALEIFYKFFIISRRQSFTFRKQSFNWLT